MTKTSKFIFTDPQRPSNEKRQFFKKAFKNTFGYLPPPRRGRPEKEAEDKYQDIHIKLHPRALKWARGIAKKRGVGYQTIINETLLRQASRMAA
jgi:uncharacterized protein (DUF4415 family)